MIGERVAQEVDELAGDLAREDVAVFVLTAAEEVKWVGAELQGAAQVRNEAVFKGRFTSFPIDGEVRKRGRKRETVREEGRKEDIPV